MTSPTSRFSSSPVSPEEIGQLPLTDSSDVNPSKPTSVVQATVGSFSQPLPTAVPQSNPADIPDFPDKTTEKLDPNGDSPISITAAAAQEKADEILKGVSVVVKEDSATDLSASPSVESSGSAAGPSSAGSTGAPAASSSAVPSTGSTGAPAPAPAATPAPSKVDLSSVMKLVDAANTQPKGSTQTILSDVLEAIKKIPDIDVSSIEMSSQLEQDMGGFKLETYTHHSAPDELFYKVPSHYKIKFKRKDDLEPQELCINRTVYTTAKTPQEAIFAASQFVKTVSDLAQQAQLSDYSSVLEGNTSQLMDKTTFSFNFNYDKEGQPSSLSSIKVKDANNQPITLTMKADTTYSYYYQPEEGELRRVADPAEKERLRVKGETLFSSEAAALAAANYSIKDAELYDRLEEKALLKQIKDIQQEIVKKEKEFVSAAAPFIDKRSVRDQSGKLEIKGVRTKEYNEHLTALTVQKDPSAVKDGDPESIRNYAAQRKELAKYAETTSLLEKVQSKLKEYGEAAKSSGKELTDQELQDKLQEKEDAPTIKVLLDTIEQIEKDQPSTDPKKMKEMSFSEKIDYSVEYQKKLQSSPGSKIEELQTGIKQFEKDLANQHANFNKSFKKLQKIYSDLEKQKDQLQNLEKQAAEMIKSGSISHPEKAKAKAVARAISAESSPQNLKGVTDRIQRRQTTLDKLRNQLGKASLKTGVSSASSSVSSSQTRHYIDVPGNGNCLFYSIALGLRKKGNKDVQDKLKWNRNPNELRGNLKYRTELFDTAAQTLREQASNWLSDYSDNPKHPLEYVLVGGMDAENQKIDNAIRQLQNSNQALATEITELQKQNPKPDSPQSKAIGNKQKTIRDNTNSIERFEKNKYKNITDKGQDNGKRYIEATKKEGAFASTSHIIALSEHYGVPIKVIMGGGAQVYNEKVNDGKKVGDADYIPAITIAHTGGNHYQYVDE